ncbi:DUF2895 family protein [Vibrio vulnificus]
MVTEVKLVQSVAAKLEDRRQDTIKILQRVIFGLVIGICVAIYGLIDAYKVRPIWVAPDLSTGQVVASSGPYRAYFYNFSYHLFNSVWTWADSADKEYPILIKQFAPYMASSLRLRFEEELKNLSSRNVAKGRQRTVKEIVPNDIAQMVKPQGGDKAVVFLDMEIVDRLDGSVVSWRRERLSLVVAVDTSDLKNNPYMMKVIDFYREPRSLDN